MSSAIEVSVNTKKLGYLSLWDFYKDLRILLVLLGISENMRRGVIYYQINDEEDELTELQCFNEIIDVLLNKHDVVYDETNAEPEIGH